MIRAFSPKGSPGFSFQSFFVPQKGFPLQSLTQTSLKNNYGLIKSCVKIFIILCLEKKNLCFKTKNKRSINSLKIIYRCRIEFGMTRSQIRMLILNPGHSELDSESF